MVTTLAFHYIWKNAMSIRHGLKFAAKAGVLPQISADMVGAHRSLCSLTQPWALTPRHGVETARAKMTIVVTHAHVNRRQATSNLNDCTENDCSKSRSRDVGSTLEHVSKLRL